jgi:hypothetical protein
MHDCCPAGTTTTTEALYMGVPCITKLGHCHAHNVGASLLAAVGLYNPPPQRACSAAQPSGQGRVQEDLRASGAGVSMSGPVLGGSPVADAGRGSAPIWVARTDEEYVALAVAHAADFAVSAFDARTALVCPTTSYQRRPGAAVAGATRPGVPCCMRLWSDVARCGSMWVAGSGGAALEPARPNAGQPAM